MFGNCIKKSAVEMPSVELLMWYFIFCLVYRIDHWHLNRKQDICYRIHRLHNRMIRNWNLASCSKRCLCFNLGVFSFIFWQKRSLTKLFKSWLLTVLDGRCSRTGFLFRYWVGFNVLLIFWYFKNSNKNYIIIIIFV